MNNILQKLSNFWNNLQDDLFPRLEERLNPLLESHRRLISVLELIKIEQFTQSVYFKGRPSASRSAIARAFVAKCILNIPTTELLIERLYCDKTLRTICGWEYKMIPSASTFSRAFSEFTRANLPELVHTTLIKQSYQDEIVGHLSRDATEISMREKSKRASIEAQDKHKKKSGGPRTKGPGKCERQLNQSLEEMLSDIKMDCDFGSKVSSKGHRLNWIGYKLHVDVADGGIPISCKLTAASVADATMAIPLSIISNQKVTALYELMDKGYYAKAISQFIEDQGRKSLIAECPKSTTTKIQQVEELKARRALNWQPAEIERQKNRTTVERFFSNLKDNFCGRMIRVKGNQKVFCHLMFGVLALTADQLLKIPQG